MAGPPGSRSLEDASGTASFAGSRRHRRACVSACAVGDRVGRAFRPTRGRSAVSASVGRSRRPRPDSVVDAAPAGRRVAASRLVSRPVPVRIPLGDRLEEQHGTCDRRVERPDPPRIGMRMNRSQRRRMAGPRPWPSLPTTIASGPRRSVWRAVSGASASEPAIRSPCAWRSASAPGRSSTGQSSRCSVAPAEALTAAGLSGAWRRVGKTTPWIAGRFGAAQQRPDILWILERIEDEDERRLAAFLGPGQDVVERGEATRFDDERDALVAIEAGDRGERSAFDLDDRDAQPGGVEDQLLERVPSLWHDEQAMSGPAGGEDLLDRSTAGDQLLVGSEQVGRRERLARAWPWSGLVAPAGPRPGIRRAQGSGSGRWTV